MKALWVLTTQRLNDVFRDRVSTFFYLGLPMVVLLILAFVFGQGHPFERKTIVLVGRSDASIALESVLRADPTLHLIDDASRESAERRLGARSANVVIIAGPSLDVVVAPNEQLLGKGVLAVCPEGVHASLRTIPISHWGYLHFLFPGLLTSEVLFAGLFGMGYSMIRYRQSLFLKKLATTPLSRSTFIAAQLLGRSILVALQMALLVVTMVLFFELPLSAGALAAMGILSALGLFVFSGLGFLMACVVKNDGVMSDIISAIGVPVTLLSGMFFSIDALPGPLRAVSAVLPSTILVNALRATSLYGLPLSSTVGDIAALTAWGAIMFAGALAFFRWHR